MKIIQLMIVLLEGSLANDCQTTGRTPWRNATEVYDFVGSNVTFDCPETAKTSYWTRNYTLLTESKGSIIINNHQLQIYNVSMKDENLYCCEFTYQRNAYKNCSTLKLTAFERVRVVVFPSKDITEGNNVTFSCSYKDFKDLYSLIWTKDGSVITEAANWSILNVSRSDNGLYRCRVSTSEGSGCDDVMLSVSSAPIVKVDRQDMSLHCIGIGFSNSYNILKWEHWSTNGQHVRYLNGTKNGTLYLKDVGNLYYKFDGKYECFVTDTNTGMLYSGYTEISIKGKPICTTPNVESVFGRKGGHALLSTNIYSNTDILDFEWFKGTVKCNDISKYTSTARQASVLVDMYGVMVRINTSTLYLSIANLTRFDLDSWYTVQTSNIFGKGNCSLELIAEKQLLRTVLLSYVVACLFVVILMLTLTYMIKRKAATKLNLAEARSSV